MPHELSLVLLRVVGQTHYLSELQGMPLLTSEDR